MLWEEGERNIEPENQLKMIESMKNSENSTILVAEDGNGLVGYLLVIGGNARRNRHSGYIVFGILKATEKKVLVLFYSKIRTMGI
ncbi:hypothetical protein [Gracilibacillus xinjiangensis]|uniref:N-acetyltransferase domain-containing protein n=1 Tax=Gracilibacillus xinjiangensis TaxID=1193282 RepID=A0ABV8X0M6_9BACI